MRGFSETHVDQSKVVLVDRELLWADVFLQSGGIGALREQKHAVRIASMAGGLEVTACWSTAVRVFSRNF